MRRFVLGDGVERAISLFLAGTGLMCSLQVFFGVVQT